MSLISCTIKQHIKNDQTLKNCFEKYERQTDREKERQTDTNTKEKERERRLREFTSIMKWFIPNIFKRKEFELIEYVFQVKYMASFIFNCMLLFCLKIIHVELILNGEMFEKNPGGRR